MLSQVTLCDEGAEYKQLLAQCTKTGIRLVWYAVGQRGIGKEHLVPGMVYYHRETSVPQGKYFWYRRMHDAVDRFVRIEANEVPNAIQLVLLMIEGS